MSVNDTANITTETSVLVQPIIDRGAVDVASQIITESVTTFVSTMTISTSNFTRIGESDFIPLQTLRRNEEETALNITGPLDSNIEIAHVWALWGVVIAVGLLVVVIITVLSIRCLAFPRTSKPDRKRKPSHKMPRFRRGTPKLPQRPVGVMADHGSVRKDFFHSLERGNVRSRREEATQRWLSGNLATSFQLIDGSGSGGQKSDPAHQEGIPMYETSYRHTGLDRIPENSELQQGTSFFHSPRGQSKTKPDHTILRRHANENTNEFVRVIPLNYVRDQNANIALSPSYIPQRHYARPRWNTALRPATHSRIFPHALRAVSSEPPRYPLSRRHHMGGYHHPMEVRGTGVGGAAGGGGGGMRYGASRRYKPPKHTLPKFNLAGELIATSSDPSPNGAPRRFDFSPMWGDWSFDNTVFESTTPTPRLVVPTNSPQTDDSSSTRSADSLDGVSAGLSQCNVSSDASLTVTVGTSKRASYEWDFYDPGYNNQAVRFVNGVYIPVINGKQYWV